MVMQLNRIYDNYELQTKFKDNYFMKEKRLDPIFDFAIPEVYKKDANDSRNSIHDREERIKIKGEDPAKIAQEERKSTKPEGAAKNDGPATAQKAQVIFRAHRTGRFRCWFSVSFMRAIEIHSEFYQAVCSCRNCVRSFQGPIRRKGYSDRHHNSLHFTRGELRCSEDGLGAHHILQ